MELSSRRVFKADESSDTDSDIPLATRRLIRSRVVGGAKVVSKRGYELRDRNTVKVNIAVS